MKKRNMILSIVVVGIISGCTADIDPELPLGKKEPIRFSDKITKVSSLKSNNLNKIIGLNGENDGNYNNASFIPARVIIKELNKGNIPPVALAGKKIESMDMFNIKLGDAIRMVMQGVNVGLKVEPNVDLNTPVNFKIYNKNIYAALKQIAGGAGYYVYYDGTHRELVLTPFVKREYDIPSEIFVQREVSINYGNSGTDSSSINPNFNINPTDAYIELTKLLKRIGSKDKIFNIDKQSGVIFLKERPIYIAEIDRAIKRFVQERSLQYEVQLAVVETTKQNLKQFGMDLTNISAGKHFSISSLGGSTSNNPTALISQGGVVIGGVKNYASLASTTVENASKLAFKAVLSSLSQSSNVQIVQKPVTVVQNHSVSYLAVGDQKTYVKGVKVIPSQVEGQDPTYDYDIGKYTDGLQFAVRIDKYIGKDRIGVSLAPMLNYSQLVDGPNNIKLLQTKIRQAMSVVNVRNGDIIVLSGMKSLQGEGNNNDSGIPFLGLKGTNKSEIETLFIVRVAKINNANDTQKFSTEKTRKLMRLQ